MFFTSTHVFLLQIRDENHRPLPGIELGDLGPKLGDNANDTGFMRLEGVRIPREHMLSRFQHVTRTGKYVKHKAAKNNSKLHYSTMMYTRGRYVCVCTSYYVICCIAELILLELICCCLTSRNFLKTNSRMVREAGAKLAKACVISIRYSCVRKELLYSLDVTERPIIDLQMQRYRLFKQLALAYAMRATGKWMTERFKDLQVRNAHFAIAAMQCT